MMRSRIAGLNLNGQQAQTPPVGDFDVGNKLGTNRVGNEICQPLLCLKDIAYSANPSRAILDTDQ